MKKFLLLALLLLSASAFAQVGKEKYSVLSSDDTTTSTSFKGTHLTFTPDSSRLADTAQVWAVEGILFTGSSSAAAIGLSWTMATNDTANIAFLGTDSTTAQIKSTEIIADSGAGIPWNCANAQTGKVFVEGTIVIAKGGAKKPFTFLLKKFTSGTATVRRKSWVKWTRIK